MKAGGRGLALCAHQSRDALAGHARGEAAAMKRGRHRACRRRYTSLRQDGCARRRRPRRAGAGCMVGLIGPDGVGKSTRLALAGRRHPRSRSGKVQGARRRYGEPAAAGSGLSAGELPACRRGWAGTSTPCCRSPRILDFFAQLFNQGGSRARSAASPRCPRATGLAPHP